MEAPCTSLGKGVRIMSGGETELINAIPWAQFGLAGLFGVFALMLTKYFLAHLEKREDTFMRFLDGEREQRRQLMEQANGTMVEVARRLDALTNAIRSVQNAKGKER